MIVRQIKALAFVKNIFEFSFVCFIRKHFKYFCCLFWFTVPKKILSSYQHRFSILTLQYQQITMIKSGTIPVFDKNNVSAYIPIICDGAFKVSEKYVFYKIEERPFQFAVENSKIITMFCFFNSCSQQSAQKPSRYISDMWSFDISVRYCIR